MKFMKVAIVLPDGEYETPLDDIRRQGQEFRLYLESEGQVAPIPIWGHEKYDPHEGVCYDGYIVVNGKFLMEDTKLLSLMEREFTILEFIQACVCLNEYQSLLDPFWGD